MRKSDPALRGLKSSALLTLKTCAAQHLTSTSGVSKRSKKNATKNVNVRRKRRIVIADVHLVRSLEMDTTRTTNRDHRAMNVSAQDTSPGPQSPTRMRLSVDVQLASARGSIAAVTALFIVLNAVPDLIVVRPGNGRGMTGPRVFTTARDANVRRKESVSIGLATVM
jgi:hypothetical protein